MMSARRRALTYTIFGLAALLVAVAAGAVPNLRQRHTTPPPPPPPIVQSPAPPATPTPPPQIAVQPAPPEVPQVEVVFALDTTSSMSGLIDGAKRKIWSLVNFISSAQPTPHVRIGIVAYRDRGDAYVTKVYDLSDDLDQVFQHLMRLRAEGGGDTPEDVGTGLHDAISRQSWSQEGKVARLIYLVGDAPPHTDYEGGYNIEALARRAADRGIHVNTIRCGDDGETSTAFRRIAHLGKGQFATVDQSGGMAEIATAYDSKLAELNKRLLGTTMAYGRDGESMRGKVAAALAAPTTAAADRADFASRGGGAISGEGDLIGRLGSIGKGAGGLKDIPAADLPAPLAAMPAAERERVVADKLAERKRVIDEIRELSTRRSAAMVKAKAAAPAKAEGFDDHVKKSLREETAGMLTF